MASFDYAIGIDLGGTRIKAIAAANDGAVLATVDERRIDAPAGEGGAPVWAERVRAIVAQLEAEVGEGAARIGLAAPGLPAPSGRSIAHMPGRLAGLEGLDWTELLERDRPVPVINDAQAAMLAEMWVGAAQDLDDAVLITLGTGVGGAILSGGRLLRGHIGRAGHLGHLCLDPHGRPGITGMPGSLEDAIGDCTIAERTGGRFLSTEAVVKACRRGDEHAARVWRESIRCLACAIASLANILDPQAFLIGGGIAAAGPALFEPLQAALDKIEWRPANHQVQLRPTQSGPHAGALGAARNARAGSYHNNAGARV